MTAARMIALLIGVGVLYTLQFMVGWPWYFAIPLAVVCYAVARYAGETMIRKRGPSA